MSADQRALTTMGPRDYLNVVRRWKWVVALTVVIVVGVALATSLSAEKTYGSSVQLLLAAGPDAGSTQIETQIEVLTSQEVRDIVTARLPGAVSVSARQIGESTVIEVSAVASDAQAAADSANAWAESYIAYQQQEQLDSLARTTAALEARRTDIQEDLDNLGAEQAAAAAEIEASTQPEEVRAEQLSDLDSQISSRRSSLTQQLLLLEQRVRDLQLEATLSSAGGRVLTPARPASSPSSPTPRRDAVTAVGIGLLLGVALAFGLEYLDDTISDKDALVEATNGLPVLGMIPTSPINSGRKSTPEVVSLTAPRSPTAEAYRSLRTSITFLLLDKELSTVLVTSPTSMDGKTSTASNLAVALATAGRWVTLVDCDLRRPQLHNYFDLDNEVGLTSFMLGEATLSDSVHDIEGVPNLSVVPSGPIPPNPSELLSSGRFLQVLQRLRTGGRLVILDSSALLPVTDSEILAALSDAVLVVVSAGSTSRRDLASALDQLRQVDAPIMGTVLNQVDPSELLLYYDNRTKRDRKREDRGGKKRPVAAPDDGRTRSERWRLGATTPTPVRMRPASEFAAAERQRPVARAWASRYPRPQRAHGSR